MYMNDIITQTAVEAHSETGKGEIDLLKQPWTECYRFSLFAKDLSGSLGMPKESLPIEKCHSSPST